jgi:hypothetical protein
MRMLTTVPQDDLDVMSKANDVITMGSISMRSLVIG